MYHYLIALGSNCRHPRFGLPARVLSAALTALERAGVNIVARSETMRSRPVGPSDREYANAAAVIGSDLAPLALLALLKRIERDFGRSRRGQCWSARVLDLDIILWSGGCWASPGLVIPHVAWRGRRFVTDPARQVAAGWRDPLTGASARQVHARLTRPRALPKSPAIQRQRRVGP